MLKRRSLSRGYGEATTTTTLARMQATAVSETSLSPAYLSTCANRCVPAPSRRAVTHVYTKVHSEVFIRLPQAMYDLDYSVVAVLEVYGDHLHGIRVSKLCGCRHGRVSVPFPPPVAPFGLGWSATSGI